MSTEGEVRLRCSKMLTPSYALREFAVLEPFPITIVVEEAT